MSRKNSPKSPSSGIKTPPMVQELNILLRKYKVLHSKQYDLNHDLLTLKDANIGLKVGVNSLKDETNALKDKTNAIAKVPVHLRPDDISIVHRVFACNQILINENKILTNESNMLTNENKMLNELRLSQEEALKNLNPQHTVDSDDSSEEEKSPKKVKQHKTKKRNKKKPPENDRRRSNTRDGRTSQRGNSRPGTLQRGTLQRGPLRPGPLQRGTSLGGKVPRSPLSDSDLENRNRWNEIT